MKLLSNSETKEYRCTADQRQTEDIYLTECGIEVCPPDSAVPSDRRSGYCLNVILSGKGVLSVNGLEQELHLGQLFITRPDGDARYQTDQNDRWVCCWMAFDGANAQRYAESAGFRDGVNCLDCHADGQRFYQLVKRALELSEPTQANDLRRLGLLLEFIALAIESNRRTETKVSREYPTDVYVEHAVNYMQSNYATARISDVAGYIGIHRSYLTVIFKKKMGISPQEYLMRCRMIRVQTLLLGTRLPIQEVGRQVGYDNPLTFSKVFKSFYGVSPNNYRSNHIAVGETDNDSEKESDK